MLLLGESVLNRYKKNAPVPETKHLDNGSEIPNNARDVTGNTAAREPERVDLKYKKGSEGDLKNVKLDEQLLPVGSISSEDVLPNRVVKRFEWLEGATDVNPTLIPNLRKKGWTVEIVEQGHPEYARMVEELTSGEYLGGKTMRLLKKPGENLKQVTVLEEFLHGTQGKIPHFDDIHPYPRYEIQVKDFMIRHRNSLGLQDADVSVLERQIMNYVNRSKMDINGVPLSYPPYTRP